MLFWGPTSVFVYLFILFQLAVVHFPYIKYQLGIKQKRDNYDCSISIPILLFLFSEWHSIFRVCSVLYLFKGIIVKLEIKVTVEILQG